MLIRARVTEYVKFKTMVLLLRKNIRIFNCIHVHFVQHHNTDVLYSSSEGNFTCCIALRFQQM